MLRGQELLSFQIRRLPGNPLYWAVCLPKCLRDRKYLECLRSQLHLYLLKRRQADYSCYQQVRL